MAETFRNALQRAKQLTTEGLSLLWEFFQLSKFILEGKRKKRFLSSIVTDEIRNLKKSNKKFQNYKYGFYQRIVGWIEENKIKSTIMILLIIGASYYVCDVLQLWCFDCLKLNEIAEFQRFAATIQVTLFAVVVPFSTTVLEFVFKDYQSKIDLFHFLNRETRVLFLTVSSIILTIVLFSIEYFNDIFSFHSNVIAISITFVWLIINTIGIGYFIIIGLKFLTPYYRYRALTKYVANEIYPNELKSYMRRNTYLGLGTYSEDKDE